MSIETSQEHVQKRLGVEDPTKYNVRIQELQRIDLLATSGWPLTDLRDEEIVAFAIFRSLHSGLMYASNTGKTEGGIPLIMGVIENIRDMRPSRARLGRKELIEAIGKGRPIMPWEQPPTYEADKEEGGGFWSRLNPFRRRG